MSANFTIIKQDYVSLQDGREDQVGVTLPSVLIYDHLAWPCDFQTGQPYSLAQLMADDTLPLPQSNVARLIWQHREHAAAPLPPETASLSEIRQLEERKATVIYYIKSPLSAHIIRVSGGPQLEYVLHFLCPPDYADPVTEIPLTGGVQFIQFNDEDTVVMMGMLERAKALMQALAQGEPSAEALTAMGAVLVEHY